MVTPALGPSFGIDERAFDGREFHVKAYAICKGSNIVVETETRSTSISP